MRPDERTLKALSKQQKQQAGECAYKQNTQADQYAIGQAEVRLFGMVRRNAALADFENRSTHADWRSMGRAMGGSDDSNQETSVAASRELTVLD